MISLVEWRAVPSHPERLFRSKIFSEHFEHSLQLSVYILITSLRSALITHHRSRYDNESLPTKISRNLNTTRIGYTIR